MPETRRPLLCWSGREAAEREARRPAGSVLVSLDGRGAVASRHAVVEGDNLELLRLLQPEGAGTVQLAFLDPPYNTGRDLPYEDRFQGSDDWLSMMYPRLLLLHRLLSETGFLVCTIDDREVARLRLLLDEVFGERCFVANAVWQKAYVANQTARHLSNTHDHVLVYARDPKAARSGRIPRTPGQLAAFRNPDRDPRGPWKAENLSAGKPYSRGRFVIRTPSGRECHPPPGRWWRCSRERYERWLEEGRIWFGRDGSSRPMLKKYLSEVRPGLTPSTWWPHDECGTNKEASLELKQLFDGRAVFPTPKPVRLMRRIVALFCPEGGVVLDPFAGSGTTGHAVLEAELADGHSRPTLLVQLPEPVDLPGIPDLAALCRERLRRAAARLGVSGFSAWRLEARPEAPDGRTGAIQRSPIHTQGR